MRARTTLVFVLLLAAAAMVVLRLQPAALLSVARTDATPTSSSTAVSTRWVALMTPGPGTPTPFIFGGEAEVAQYVEERMGPDVVIVSSHISRSYIRDIRAMQAGPGGRLVTPDSTLISGAPTGTREAGAARWIVGLRALEPLSGDQIAALMGFTSLIESIPEKSTSSYPGGPTPGSVVPQPGLGYGHEIYLILDDVGNILEASFLDRLADNGHVDRYVPWKLADIDQLTRVGP